MKANGQQKSPNSTTWRGKWVTDSILTLSQVQFPWRGRLLQKDWPSGQCPDGLSCIVYRAISALGGGYGAFWQCADHDTFLKRRNSVSEIRIMEQIEIKTKNELHSATAICYPCTFNLILKLWSKGPTLYQSKKGLAKGKTIQNVRFIYRGKIKKLTFKLLSIISISDVRK